MFIIGYVLVSILNMYLFVESVNFTTVEEKQKELMEKGIELEAHLLKPEYDKFNHVELYLCFLFNSKASMQFIFILYGTKIFTNWTMIIVLYIVQAVMTFTASFENSCNCNIHIK